MLATLFTDDLCFSELNFISPQPSIEVEYTLPYCSFSKINSENCTNFSEFTVLTKITPPFVYSNQCRNALFRNFIPIVIYSCVFKAFVVPFIYFFATWKIRDLTSVFKVFCIFLNVPKLLLGDVTLSLVDICEEFVLLLLYGIISPYCAIALALSILSQVFMLRFRIIRVYQLQIAARAALKSQLREQAPVSDVEGSARYSYRYQIDAICESAQSNFLIMTRPGLLLSSIIFSIYLFDMAYDADVSSSVVNSSAIMLTVIVVSYGVRKAFQMNKHRMDAALKAKIQSINDEALDEGSARVSHIDMTVLNPLSSFSDTSSSQSSIA
jgi:hypothetical protein